MLYESQIDVYISCITRLLLRIEFKNIDIFDDVIQHDSDVISIKSLHRSIDFGLFFHMQLSIFDMHVPITHSERQLDP